MVELHVKGVVEKVYNVAVYNDEAIAMLGKLIKDLLATGTLRVTKIEEGTGKKTRNALIIEAQ